MTPTTTTTTNEVIRSLAARPGGISWSALVNLFGEHDAADAVNYLMTSAVVEAHRVDGGDWVYSVVRVKEVVG